MTTTRFTRRPQVRSRLRPQPRRRRSERLHAYYSSLPGVFVSKSQSRFQIPSQAAARQWAITHRAPLATLVVLIGVLYWFFVTDQFYVYDAHIEGTFLLTREEIYNEARLEGLSIFWVNPAALAAELETNPLIQEANVTALLPHHVSITIVERTPVAVWQSKGESLYTDKAGALFPLRGDATGAVVIRDLRDEPVQAGATVDTEAIQTALQLAELIPGRRAFDWEPAAGISFITEGGWRVSFGDHHRLAVKAAAYKAFNAQIAPFEKVELLDLSAPEHPYYRLLPNTGE